MASIEKTLRSREQIHQGLKTIKVSLQAVLWHNKQAKAPKRHPLTETRQKRQRKIGLLTTRDKNFCPEFHFITELKIPILVTPSLTRTSI
jgi:hypothetical protein